MALSTKALASPGLIEPPPLLPWYAPSLVEENGSYYGQLNANGIPKTVDVQLIPRED
jgi:hypothetical protein